MTTHRSSSSVLSPALQQSRGWASPGSQGLLLPPLFPGTHSPLCRAAAQICRRRPRHPPGQSQSSPCGGTTLWPWLFYARSRTAWWEKQRGVGISLTLEEDANPQELQLKALQVFQFFALPGRNSRFLRQLPLGREGRGLERTSSTSSSLPHSEAG